jgi:hypothetical protein
MWQLIQPAVGILTKELRPSIKLNMDNFKLFVLDHPFTKEYINQQIQSLIIIYGLAQGYFAMRTTSIASFAQGMLYNNNAPPYSIHSFHALNKPLVPEADTMKLTKRYQELYQAQLLTQTAPPKPYLRLEGQLLGRLREHLLELKYWYPYLDKDDLCHVVEGFVQNKLAPTNDALMLAILAQFQQPPKKK